MTSSASSALATTATYPMNGGNGLHSYTTNSTYQRGPAEAIKDLTNKVIASNLDNILNQNITHIRVSDMGCSVGPNTFLTIQSIIGSIQNNLRPDNSSPMEFQVFLNDHVSNDFNTVFAQSLFHQDFSSSSYYLAGVPGSFHDRLFPSSFLHLVHTSYALQWLSKVPDPVLEIDSPAWNPENVCYSRGGDKTEIAYRDQFSEDFMKFLNSREREVAPGGIVLVVIPGRSDGMTHSHVTSNITYNVMGDCLKDMVHQGKISQEKLNKLNIPIYFPSPDELKSTIKSNGTFTIEMLECIGQGKGPGTAESKANAISSHLRAGFEALLEDHFQNDTVHDQTLPFPMDELFDCFTRKLLSCGFFEDGESGLAFTIFAALKRQKE
ncbi:Probable S-adenosylmethionine-dependent methyltransferase At5g37990 [Linum grandiflorum]